MAHFAKLDNNNVVLEVIVVDNEVLLNKEFPESEKIGLDFLTSWSGGYKNWKQTSYNAKFRKNYAAPGYKYDNMKDAFIPIKPFNSWILDEKSCNWIAPVPRPDNIQNYSWDENSKSWKLFVM